MKHAWNLWCMVQGVKYSMHGDMVQVATACCKQKKYLLTPTPLPLLSTVIVKQHSDMVASTVAGGNVTLSCHRTHGNIHYDVGWYLYGPDLNPTRIVKRYLDDTLGHLDYSESEEPDESGLGMIFSITLYNLMTSENNMFVTCEAEACTKSCTANAIKSFILHVTDPPTTGPPATETPATSTPASVGMQNCAQNCSRNLDCSTGAIAVYILTGFVPPTVLLLASIIWFKCKPFSEKGSKKTSPGHTKKKNDLLKEVDDNSKDNCYVKKNEDGAG